MKIELSKNYLHPKTKSIKAKQCSLFLFVFFTFAQCTSLKKPNWQIIGSGGGGSTFIPTFSYHSNEKFLIKCDMTGSYLTNNGGESYTQINNPNGSNCFAFDPNDPKIIYIGSNFLSKSINGGKTFERIFPKNEDIESETYSGDHAEYQINTKSNSIYNKDSKKIEAIKVDPNDSKNLFFSMGSRFYYSFDGGQSWAFENLNSNIKNIYSNTVSLKNQVYFFTYDAIFVFEKSSKKLVKTQLPAEISPVNNFALGITKEKDKTLFYALHTKTTKENDYAFAPTEIWVSEDLGKNWKQLNDAVITNQQNFPSFATIACAENDANKAYVICNDLVDNQNKKHWYGAIKTSDGGKAWEWVRKGGGGSGEYGVQDAEDVTNLKDAWVHKAFGGEFIQLIDAGVSPNDGNTAVVTDWYRAMKTTDGGKNWKEIYSKKAEENSYKSRGMDVTTNYGVHFDPFDKKHIAISYTDIGYHHSFDGGKTWSRSVTGVPNEWKNTCYWVVFDPKIKYKMWSAWSGLHDFPRGKMTRNPNWKTGKLAKGGICISEDGGKTWRPSNDGLGEDSPPTCIVINPKSPPNNRTLYASIYNKGVFRSTDDGKTWVLKNSGIGENTCAFELTLASNGNLFLVVSPNPSHLGGKKGREYYSGAVYKSTDGAENWTKLSMAEGLIFPNGIEIDPKNPDRIYLASWSDISLADLVGGDVVRATGGDKTLETPGGIFLSEDGGETWKSIFDQKQYVYDVTADPYHEGRLYCNTFNKAAYRSDDFGKTWNKLKGYDFHWGHRIIIDENDHKKVFITTYGSSVWHGKPEMEK
jgi:photosystem II stability/assembly factor-like uncharacterized protein